MNELPKEATDLLADARGAHSASAAKLERNLAELHARLPFGELSPPGGNELEALRRSTALKSGKHWAASKLTKAWLSALAITGAAVLTVLSPWSDEPGRTRDRAPAAAPAAAPVDAAPVNAAPPSRPEPLLAAGGKPAPRTPGAAAQPAVADTTPEQPAGKPAPWAPGAAAQPAVADTTPEQPAGAPPVAAEPTATIVQATSAQTPASSARGAAPTRKPARSRRGQASKTPITSARAAAASRGTSTDDDAPPAQPAPEATAAPHVAAELDLIEDALASLRANDAAGALSHLAEHGARYPTGRFAVERRGLHVLALCAAGRVHEGLRARADFLERASTAPIAARVRNACADEPDSAQTRQDSP